MQIIISSFLILTLTWGSTETPSNFLNLFKKPKPLIAAVMVETEKIDSETLKKQTDWAIEQLKIAEESGLDGILLEFRGGKILHPKISKEKFDFMLSVTKSVINKSKITVGIEILWHYPQETLKLAKESGAKFVRIDFFSDHVIADEKPVPINPEEIMSFKNSINANDVFLLTDIQVKYSKMINPNISVGDSASTAEAKGSQGVIVTSHKSGIPPETNKIIAAKVALKKGTPVIIGSGFSVQSDFELYKNADAIIVGTSISEKTGGPLIRAKAKALAEKKNIWDKKINNR